VRLLIVGIAQKLNLVANEGTEALAESAMGMHVPVQPNKQDRALRNQMVGQDVKDDMEYYMQPIPAPPVSHYNLRNQETPRLHQQLEDMDLISPLQSKLIAFAYNSRRL
jgi:hypothetical protein